MACLNSTTRNHPDSEDLAAFLGSPIRQDIAGPLILYRFGNAIGRWWYDQSVMHDIKEDFLDLNYSPGPRPRTGHRDILASPRDGLAVCHDWNAFDRICKLVLPTRDRLDGWVGLVAPQPVWFTKQQGRRLRGGFTQYLLYGMDTVPTGVIEMHSTAQVWKLWSQNLMAF